MARTREKGDERATRARSAGQSMKKKPHRRCTDRGRGTSAPDWNTQGGAKKRDGGPLDWDI